MNIRFFITGLLLIVLQAMVFADAFVPDFSTMKILRCDFEQIVYNQDSSIASKSNQFRIFRLDDEFQKLYLQKEPIDKVVYYGQDRLEFYIENLTDYEIERVHTTIDRSSMSYSSESEITYDDTMFENRTTKSSGSCKFIN